MNIKLGASYGNGFGLEIRKNQDKAGIVKFPVTLKFGNVVMMEPHVVIIDVNHVYSSVILIIRLQGIKSVNRVIIEDDLWIGRHVIINPRSTNKSSSIIATETVLTKDLAEYSVPSRLIKSRFNGK